MKFSTTLAAASLVSAATAAGKDLLITKLNLVKGYDAGNDAIATKRVSFTLSGGDIKNAFTCKTNDPDSISPSTCDNSAYQFTMRPGSDNTQYTLRIMKSGYQGTAVVAVSCKPGAGNEESCDQSGSAMVKSG